MKFAVRAVLPLCVAASHGTKRTTDQLQIKSDSVEHTPLQINDDGDDEVIQSSFIQTKTVNTRSNSEGHDGTGDVVVEVASIPIAPPKSQTG